MRTRLFPLKEGRFISRKQIPEIARKARETQGLTHDQAADDLGTSPETVLKAESQPSRSLFNIRKKMLEHFSGYTLDGPYYRLKKLDPDKPPSLTR